MHPLTLLDDHSHFGLVLAACTNEQEATVWPLLTAAFTRHGLPRAVFCDNGPPWGTSGAGELTAPAASLLQLGLQVIHGRPRHPQTQGKLERWHRIIKCRMFGPALLPDRPTVQTAFDRLREIYTPKRPHQHLNGAGPISCCQPIPHALPEIDYDENTKVARVRQKGEIIFHGRRGFISCGAAGQPIGIEPTTPGGAFVVRYCQQQVATNDLRQTS